MQSFDRTVPFCANTPDGKRCYQAVVKMVLQTFRPALDGSWQALDRITAKLDDGGTWPFAGMVWLADNGFEVRNIELMDNERFAREGRAYLDEFFGRHAAEIESQTDYASEQAQARRFVETVDCEIRMPGIEDLRSLLLDGYLAICNVNSRALNGRDGYSGHFVVVKGFDADALLLHDPGPPPRADRRVALADFDKAWAFPDDKARNLIAVRMRG